MKIPIRPQPDTIARLKAQRDALQKRLADAERRLERLDDLEPAELIALSDEVATVRRTLAIVAERLDAAELAERQTASAEEEEKRLAELAAERKAYDAALAAVVGDTIHLDASLQALTAVRLRLGALGDLGAADATLHLAQAVARTLLIWRIVSPAWLGLPARNPDAERRADAIDDASARLERAERRRDALRDAAKQGYTVRGVDSDAANADVKSARRQLALASGQPWTAQDEAQAERSDGLVFTMKSPAELEESLRRQSHAEALAPPARMDAPSRRR